MTLLNGVINEFPRTQQQFPTMGKLYREELTPAASGSKALIITSAKAPNMTKEEQTNCTEEAHINQRSILSSLKTSLTFNNN